jgi:apolipoprotein N-acyltransferase
VGFLDASGRPSSATVYYNAALHFSPEGVPGGIYRKTHLVPFGEFVPFQKFLSFLGPVIRDLGQLERGRAYSLFQASGFTYSPLICYEVTFPEDARKALLNGADALVNISNDAWYGNTASPYQHAMMAVVRAAENQKPLLRASNSGICLVTDPFGKVLASSRLFERTVLKGEVFLKRGSGTLYAQWGSWFPKLCLLLLFAAGVGAIRAAPALEREKT